MIQLQIATNLSTPKPGTLTAALDLAPGAQLAAAATLAAHPAQSDLKRWLKGQDPAKSAYMATGEAPLLYLPAGLAPHWDAPEQTRILAARALQTAAERRDSRLTILLDGPDGADHVAAAEGLLLADYRFDKYRSDNGSPRKPAPAIKVELLVASTAARKARAALAAVQVTSAAVNHARDMVNEPGSTFTPADFEKEARALARDRKLKLSVLNAAELKKQKYTGLLHVGRGNDVPPRMIVLTYDPPKARRGIHLGLLGKGLTFDTGGYSLKPGAGMMWMKGDMAGGAAVLAAIGAIAQLALPVKVTAVIVTSQNMVDAKANVPGDIFVARNGKSIQVDNTDAEGRLILTDGLYRMGQEKVTHVVDVATLTGACMRALGLSVSGAFGNDGFTDAVAEVATRRGEPAWRLPLVEEYTELLKTEAADLNNIGSHPNGGAITAALFLREFVPAGVHWTHLDIAGTFFTERAQKYYRPGATGVMVRSFIALAEAMSNGEVK